MERITASAEGAVCRPLNCEEVGELLYLFICDELDDEESSQVSAHLSTCSTCRTDLSETVKISGTLSAVMPRIPLHYYSQNN